MDCVKADVPRRLYPINPFRLDRWEDLAPVPLRDFAGRFLWREGPRNFHHRNPPAPGYTGAAGNMANVCSFAVSDGSIASAPGPGMDCERGPGRRQGSYLA